LTATARDGDGNVRSGWKNARGAGRTKEWSNNARRMPEIGTSGSCADARAGQKASTVACSLAS
jgi:hypothetical protein